MFVQTYVINNLTIEILLKINVIENYNIDLLIFKRIITLNNNEILILFNKIDDIIINHNIIELIILIDSFNLSKIITFKSIFFANCFDLIFRIHFLINYKLKTLQNINKKQSILKKFISKFYKC